MTPLPHDHPFNGGPQHIPGTRSGTRAGLPETRQLSTFDPARRKKTKALPRKTRTTIGEIRGSGYIASLWLTLPNWFWGHWAPDTPVHQSLLKTVILRMYWDDATQPAVEAPVGDFFGIGLCRVANFASRYFGMSSGGFFSRFIMPFRKGFRIEMENLDEHADTEIFMNVLYQLDDSAGEDIRYFHAHFNTGRNNGPDPMPVAHFEGRGRYIGCTVSMQGKQKCYLRFMEAPEHIYVDDDWDSPRMIGTGLEDYFLGGWYFREGCFTGPLHGLTVKDVIHSAVAMYRIHDHDAVFFNRRFRMTFVNYWEHAKLREFCYSSVAYAMLDTPEGTGRRLPGVDDLMCWYRIRDIDHSWNGQ